MTRDFMNTRTGSCRHMGALSSFTITLSLSRQIGGRGGFVEGTASAAVPIVLNSLPIIWVPTRQVVDLPLVTLVAFEQRFTSASKVPQEAGNLRRLA